MRFGGATFGEGSVQIGIALGKWGHISHLNVAIVRYIRLIENSRRGLRDGCGI